MRKVLKVKLPATLLGLGYLLSLAYNVPLHAQTEQPIPIYAIEWNPAAKNLTGSAYKGVKYLDINGNPVPDGSKASHISYYRFPS